MSNSKFWDVMNQNKENTKNNTPIINQNVSQKSSSDKFWDVMGNSKFDNFTAEDFTAELGKIPDFIKQSASDFKNYGYSSSDDVYNGIVSGVDNYKRTIENAKKYNPEWYEKNKVNVDDVVKALDEVYNSYAQKRDVYKQFSTEQDFNDAVNYNFYSTTADIDRAIKDIGSQKASVQAELDTINANKKAGLVAGSIWESQNGAKINELEKKLQQLDEKEASFTNAKSELKRNQNLRDRYNKKLSFGGVQNVPEFAEYSEKGSKDYTVDVSGSIYDIAQSYNSERNKDGFNNQNKLALFWAITDKYPELLKDGVSIYDIEGVRFNGGEHLDYFITQLKNGMTVGLKDEQGNITESVDIQVSQMDDTQRKIYNYLFAMNGAEVADEYLAVSGEELSKRKGEAEVEALEGKPLKQIWYGFTQAPKQWEQDFLQSMSGLNAQYPVSHPSVYGSQKIKEDETLGGFGRFVFDVAQTSGYQLPAQAVSLLVGGFAGDKASAITNGLMMGMGAAGGAYTEAINMGYDTDQARSYAIMVGAAETALESLSDGATKAGGLITGNALKKATSGIKSGIGKFAIKLPGKMLSEATEEYLAEVLDTAWKNIAFDRADDLEWLSGDAFYAALLGAVSAVGMGSISSVSDIRFETARDQIIDAGLSLAHDTEAYKLASSLESKKYKLEPKQLQDLSNKIQETTAKMYEAKIEQNRKWYKQIRNELVSLGETGDVSAIASAIVRLKNNDAITVNDLKLIADSKLAADYGFNPSENTTTQTEDTQNEVNSVLPKVSAAAPEVDPIKDWAYKEHRVERLTDDQKYIRKVGEAFGRKVHFAHMDRWIKGKDGKRRLFSPNGMFDEKTGDIWINTSQAIPHDPLGFILKHELTEFAETNPDFYSKFMKAVLKSKEFEKWLRKKTGSKTKTVDQMVAELANKEGSKRADYNIKQGPYKSIQEVYANFVGDMLFEKSNLTLDNLIDNLDAKSKPRFIQALLDIIDWLKQKLKGNKEITIELVRLETKYLRALNAAQKAWEQKQQTTENVKQNISPDSEGVMENANGEPVAHSVGDGTVQFSLSTYEVDGRSQLREYLEKCVSSDRLTQEEMNEMLDGIEEIYDICKEFKDKYAPFGSWSDAAVIRDTHGKPVFSVVTPNGEYKMNLDFSLVCKKRRTLDAVFNLMADEGILDEFELGQKSIVKINEIIRKYGFETACSLCFVDAKRFRQAAVADSFVNLYNELVESLVPESERDSISRFDFLERGLNKEGKQGIDTWDNSRLDFSHLDKVMKEYGSKTVEHKAAKYIKAHPEARKLLIRGEFMSSEDFGAVKTKAPEIMKLYNSKKGTGGPKAAFGDVQYLNEIIKKARNWTPNKAYMVGGVRIQSFSDYVPRMIFDYVQMIYDLAATKLPAHAYTKEVLFVKQFGLTGIKINMSLIPAIAEDGVAPGLDKNGNYVWAGESFDYDAAIKIQNAEGYTENCGTIAVGVSKEHILKLLRDPNIRMVIPYHKSGLNPIVAHMNKIDAFTDYTNSQNTLDKEGKKVAKDFNFNKALHDMGENGSPKAVAKQYLDWCAENDYMPKFAEFSKNANYYKLLEDFNLYDKSGKYAPQREVRAVFPTEDSAFGSMKQLIRQGLEEDAIVEGKRNEDLPKIVNEIKRTLPKTEAEISEDAVKQADTDLEARFSYSLPESKQYSLSAQTDSAYLDAVSRGDMETAQRMVDEAAREAGYDTDAYHGTNQGNFSIFDWDKTQRADGGFFGRGHYFTKSEGMAKLYGKRIIKGKLRLGNTFVWKEEINSYKGKVPPELLSRNIVSRINMAKIFPDIFANKTMSYWEYDSENGENVEKTIKWGELERIVNELTEGLTLRRYADGTYRWHTEGRFWEVPVGDSYSSVEEANEGKFFAAINSLKEKYDGLLSSITYDDQTTYTQIYGTEITESLKKNGYESAMDTTEGGEIVVFDSSQIKSADPVTYDDNGEVIPLSERFNSDNEDLRYSLPDESTNKNTDFTAEMDALDEQYQNGEIDRADYLEQMNDLYRKAGETYGTIKKGETVTGNENFDNPVPQSVDGNKQTRTHVRTVLEGGQLTEDMVEAIKQMLLHNKISYTPTSNQSNIDYAERAIKAGTAKGIWQRVVNGEQTPSAGDIAIGEALLKLAVERKDAVAVATLTAELSEVGTRAGQAVQAFSLLKRMNGVGQLYYLQRSVDSLNKDLMKKHGKKAPVITIDPTMAQQLAEAKTPEDFDYTYGAILRDIGAQVPSTYLDKWNAWRYMAMLFNPTTHIRNIFGNAIFSPSVKLKDTLGWLGERFLPKDKRTKSVVISKVYKDFAKDDFKNVENILKGTGKMNPKMGIQDNKKVFKTRWLEWMRQKNFDLLEAEDAIFLKGHYVRAFGGYLQARKIDVKTATADVIAKAREYAIGEALKATYRDTSELANLISRLSNKNAIANVLLEGILPFKKTPINITKRGFEYSPYGLLKTLSKGLYDLKKGNITASQWIDGLAANLTGVGIFALGYFLSSMGVVKGAIGDDEEDWFDRMLGMQEYSIEIGGFSYTMDWAAPACMPFFMGVTTQETAEEEGNADFISATINALGNGLEPYINMSMLSGIRDVIESTKYSDSSDIVQTIASDIILSYFSQALPTIGSKVSNLFVEDRRTSYIDKTSWMPKIMQQALDKVYGKVPWLANQRANYINAWGEKESNGGFFRRFLQNFVSPGYISDVEVDRIDEEVKQLAESTGEQSVFPDKPKKYVKFKGYTKDLTTEEYEEYAVEVGQASADYISDCVRNAEYKKLTDEQKVEVITNLYAYANAKAKTKLSYTYDEVNAMYNGEITKAMWNKYNSKTRKALANEYFLDKYQKPYQAERNGGSAIDYYITKAKE